MLYLMFTGNCAEALDTYSKAFNTAPDKVMKYSDMPPSPNFKVEEHMKNHVLNASITINGIVIMASDTPDRTTSNNMFVNITSKETAFVQGAWDVLSKEASEIYMEPGETFFAHFHGSLKDKYGINWMFTVEKEMTMPSN